MVISYSNNEVTKIEEMVSLIRGINNNLDISIVDLGNYGYTLNRNNINNNEILIIAENTSIEI